jgi:hypothetical protein
MFYQDNRYINFCNIFVENACIVCVLQLDKAIHRQVYIDTNRLIQTDADSQWYTERDIHTYGDTQKDRQSDTETNTERHRFT